MLPTPEEIEQAVRRGCAGLPEAVVRLNVAEAVAYYEGLERGEGDGSRGKCKDLGAYSTAG